MKKDSCITSPKSSDDTIKNELVSVVLLCDTPGYRMKSYGAIPLIPFGRQRLIDIQIQSLKKVFHNFELIICVGYDAEKVCKYIKNKYRQKNIRIVENQKYETSNSCEGVRLCLNNINNGRIVICDGSLIVEKGTLNNIVSEKSHVLTEDGFLENLEIGINVGESGNIEHFGFGAHRAWSEIVYLSNPDIIECLRKIISTENFRQKFLFEGLNELIKTKHRILAVTNKHPVKKINNIKTYHKIRNEI